MLLKNISQSDLRLIFLDSTPLFVSPHSVALGYEVFSDYPSNDILLWLVIGLILISSSKAFVHCVMLGKTEPWPHFFWLVEVSMGLAACCTEYICPLVLFVTEFLITFFSFQDGVTLYSFSCDPMTLSFFNKSLKKVWKLFKRIFFCIQINKCFSKE